MRATSSLLRTALLPTLLLSLLAACGERKPRSHPQGAPDAVSDRLLHPRRLRATAPDHFRVRFTTTRGEFVVEVHRTWAPRGADRFYNLVKNGFYDGDRVYRVLKGYMAQWGVSPDPRVSAVWKDAIIVDDPVSQSNKRGRIAFAQSGPQSRTTEVFVDLRDNPDLDAHGFAPFGEVVKGMDVVEAFYAGYGDGPPRGSGPYQAAAEAAGEAYFAKDFPKLDRITSASVEPESSAPGGSTLPGADSSR
jgi:peptidyl-prolyl cis-trans isomerase A (cyclophilin A)